MVELSYLFRRHPIFTGFVLLCITPAFIPFVVFLSPLLLHILRLRNKNRHGLSRGRRKCKREIGLSFALPEFEQTQRAFCSKLRGEKWIRLNAYLEDQMKFVLETNAIAGQVFCTPNLEQKNEILSCNADANQVRSDLSDVGDFSETVSAEDWYEDWEDFMVATS